MDFLTLARNRYSVRKFDSRKVEAEKQEMIIRAAGFAPTAKNLQPQRILVLESKEALEKLSKTTNSMYGCTLAYVICYDDTVSWKRHFDGKDSGDIDASIVASHMMLMASEIGIGSTWVMSFDSALLKELFELPENIHPTAVLVMGYPAPDAEPSERHIQSIPTDKMIIGRK